jgi:hypothetical protein
VAAPLDGTREERLQEEQRVQPEHDGERPPEAQRHGRRTLLAPQHLERHRYRQRSQREERRRLQRPTRRGDEGREHRYVERGLVCRVLATLRAITRSGQSVLLVEQNVHHSLRLAYLGL